MTENSVKKYSEQLGLSAFLYIFIIEAGTFIMGLVPETGLLYWFVYAVTLTLASAAACRMIGNSSIETEAKAKQSYLMIPTAFIACFSMNFLFAGGTGSETLTNGSLAARLLFQSLVPAVCEEFYFRKYITGFLTRNGRENAVLVSALIFAASHLSFRRFIPAFLCGLVLGELYQETHNVYMCMIVHALNNASAIFYGYADGRAFTIINYVLYIIGIISAMMIAYKLFRNIRNGKYGGISEVFSGIPMILLLVACLIVAAGGIL